MNGLEFFIVQAPEQLAHRIFEFLQQRAPQALGGVGEEIRTHVQLLVREALGRMDLVTREEFAIQEKVLARTRSKLDALEKQVAALEAAQASSAPGDKPHQEGA